MLQRDRQRQRERGTFSGGGAGAFTAEYLVVAGGGSGGGYLGAGGGAGGYRSSVTGESSGGGASAESPLSIVLGTPYTITVGAGGASGTASAPGFNGADSVFATVTSLGGGYGGSNTGSGYPYIAGAVGGSGGGGTQASAGSAGTAGQGFAGGAQITWASDYGTGGGGGAAQAGSDGSSTFVGDGGNGVQSLATGTAVYRAGGGGGSSYNGALGAGSGGLGGGGTGGNNGLGTNGVTNTGGGGGGTGNLSSASAAGGSGVVIIRVPSTVVAEFSAGVVYNYIPLDDFNVYEITAAGVSDTVTFSQGALATIEDSLRFNDDDSAYLSRTPASAGDRKTWTWSGWVKRGNLVNGMLFHAGNGSTNTTWLDLGFNSDRLSLSLYSTYLRTSTAVLRDPSAWYHVVLALDTTAAQAADRVKIYINGEQVSDFDDNNAPTLNGDYAVNTATQHNIGRSRTSNYLDGYLSDVYFIDGQALDPSRFGKQDADGVWQPISYTGSYGTNGFHLDFADNSTAAALGTDVSGNSNDWTPSGITTADQVTDTPSVNYCTLNPIDARTTGTLSDGNLVTSGNATVTIRPTTGQYYYEKNNVGVSYDTSVSGPFDPVLTAGSYNFGQLPWADTGPTGSEVALNTANLPAPVITDGKEHFQPALYTGNGTTQAIGGLEFQPDFVWIKNRSATDNHKLLDAVRGATEELESNTTDAEATNSDGLTAFNSNGFTVGADPEYNTSGENFVAWNWNAGGSTVTNTDGSITSQVRANTTAGFSVLTYTADGSSSNGVGHGLNETPTFMIYKNRAGGPWGVWTTAIDGSDDYLQLNSTVAASALSGYGSPTSTTISNFGFGAGQPVLVYCFHSVDGFSKFGTYTGNGSADGPFVYTGFRPAFVIIKRTDATASWFMFDSKVNSSNVVDKYLAPDLTIAEATFTGQDFLSNGFKIRATTPVWNASGGTYIYMAFAENPFQLSRAR